MAANPGPSIPFSSKGFYRRNEQASSRIARYVENLLATSDAEEEDVCDEAEEAYVPSLEDVLATADDSQGEEDSEDEYGVVLEVTEDLPQPAVPRKRRRQTNRPHWEQVSARQNSPTVPRFDSPDENAEHSLKLPIEYFRDFFSNHLFDHIVEQSNLYSVQKNVGKPLELTQVELEQWIGTCMYMSISKIPNTRLHWSGMDDVIVSVMSRDRWEQIKANLHLVDNTTNDNTDKLFKVRPLVDHLRAEFQRLPMIENL